MKCLKMKNKCRNRDIHSGIIFHNNVHQCTRNFSANIRQTSFLFGLFIFQIAMSIYHQTLKQYRTSKCPYMVSSGLAFYYNSHFIITLFELVRTADL